MPLPETSLIATIRRRVRSRTPHIISGIGDDCAILKIPPRHEALVTTDFTLENVHFRREWHTPDTVGHRCLVRGLSDIAAMGGEPIAAFLSLALPRHLSQRWVDEFINGFLALADQFKTTLAGGDISQSPSRILADIIVVGCVPRGRAVLRSGAKPGDHIFVTGSLGESAAALRELRRGQKLKPSDYPRHFHPVPRLALGRYLRSRRFATAMIDLSDGLSTDLAHICRESHVGAEILAASIPIAQAGNPRRPASLAFALNGGEDYELLFTAPPNAPVPPKILGIHVTQIGSITSGKRIWLIEQDRKHPLPAKGWQHFHP